MLKKDLLSIVNTPHTYEVSQLDAAIKALCTGKTVKLILLNRTVVTLPTLPQYKKEIVHATTFFARLQKEQIDRENDKINIERNRIINEIREQYGKDAAQEKQWATGQYAKMGVTRTSLLHELNALRLDDLRASDRFVQIGINAKTQIAALINNASLELLELTYNEIAPAFGLPIGTFTWDTDMEHSFESDSQHQFEYPNQTRVIWTDEYYWEGEPTTSYEPQPNKLMAPNRLPVSAKDVILALYYQMLFDAGLIELEPGYYVCECGHILRAVNKAVYTDNVELPTKYFAFDDDDDDKIYCPYCDRVRKAMAEI